ncbi:MAG: transglycosylase domain-containing protein [Anaerolineae bacterium]|nr:transglycosylase domain-containing protein [Anaerolineae bacterium]
MHRLFIGYRRQPRWKRIVLPIGIALLIGLGALSLWLFSDLPSIDQLHAGLALPSTRIYDRQGRLLYEIIADSQDGGLNTAIPLESIPRHCVNAVIATEDANFYSHPGVDLAGVVRALWINLQGGEVIAGGSTITQQVARMLLLDPQQRAERSLRRKLREMILALQLQNAYSKDDVLALYFNQSYFGNLAYGIEAAAGAYFGKSAPELSLAECSLLAGLVQAPALYDPLTDLEAARARQAVVLNLMVGTGTLTAEEADSAAREALQFAAAPFPIEAPHFVMAVIRQLEREFPEQITREGLEVITTVDLDWTRQAQEIVGRQLDALNHPASAAEVPANANNAALVALDPYTGQVLTLLGSPDYFDESIDGAVNAALALRQPGSALKPFTYAAAMNPDRDHPYTAATMLLDIETPFITRRLESYTPANYAQVENGPVLVREALASSFNIPAVLTLNDIGISSLIDLGVDAGLATLGRNTELDLSVTLGGGEVRLLDLTAAYSIFPNGGCRVDPALILRVTDRAGETLYEWTPPAACGETGSARLIDTRVAWLISDILSDDTARVRSFGRNSALAIGRAAAAKTGTTTDFRDNWVVGYTPNLVVGVWVGNADNTPMIDVTGVSGAAPIWNAFMRGALLGQPELRFQQPEGLTRREICALSGKLATPQCPRRRLEWFVEGTEPQDSDDFYQVFQIDRETGLLAQESTPEDRREARIFVVLPQEARDWGIRNGLTPPPQGAAVTPTDRTDAVRLLEPDPYTVFEISPLLPQSAQRIRLTVGAPPGVTQVVYLLDGAVLATTDTAPWEFWWALETGDHTLVARAIFADGTMQESEPLPFSVVPPQSETKAG